MALSSAPIQGDTPARPWVHTLVLVVLWLVFYGSFTLVSPALLDDADSVHAEVAREMLLRLDWVTLYANGIRYLEKAPLLYWAMAASMRLAQLLGHGTAAALAVAARMPLALTVLALAFAVETFARRAFRSVHAGLYAALIVLSSFGVFLFTRILIPDAALTLWMVLGLYAFWTTEPASSRDGSDAQRHRRACSGFAVCCALAVLTKGLIGLLFPVTIVAAYLLVSRGWRGALRRLRLFHPVSSIAIFVAIAAPWHVLIALANPAQGHPGGLSFTLHPRAGTGHWYVPLPSDGNVHGWAWFYFVNEHLLRYLNLRVPRDYDTVPLWLFLGLCFVWLMPWSAFLVQAVVRAVRSACAAAVSSSESETGQRAASLLLLLAAAIPLLFFCFSTRQEYYVLPALPPLAMLVAGWLAEDVDADTLGRRSMLRAAAALLAIGALFAVVAAYFLLHTAVAAPKADLAELLQQNPADYAMSMGHFLDLNAKALALFRLPLGLAAAAWFFAPLAAWLLLRRAHLHDGGRYVHAAIVALAGGAFAFLLAAHLGLQTFAPVLSSQELASALAPQLHVQAGEEPPLIVIHQEYEYASTLGFYLHRPAYNFDAHNGRPYPMPHGAIHILTDALHDGTPNYGRTANLWYGSFFSDAPAIFETAQSLAAKWRGPQRIFVWQDLADQPSPLPAALTPKYLVASSGGKAIYSNQPDPH